MPAKLPNCFKCINYFITHDPAQPYGCRAMRFKSKTNPGRVVYINSGMVCQLYSPKGTPKGGGNSNSIVA